MQSVKIRIRRATRVYTFLCPDIELQRDDPCIVRSDRGLEYGVCVIPPESCPDDAGERIKMEVVRKASLSDEADFIELQTEEHKAMQVCEEKIRERHLPMKLVDAEYTFDKHKAVFYFTAADRVDFRQLVRDLAQALRVRIELRHIQVRDAARLTGGLGVCGRELCCASWLREFKPISMKMAKRQNLSLNPTKISGQCGRLLCCLGYENDQYGGKKIASALASSGEAVREEGLEEIFEEDDLSALIDIGESIAYDDEELNNLTDEYEPFSPESAAPPATGAPVAQGQEAPKKRKRRRKRKHTSPGANSPETSEPDES